ncbi:uncharacterized protein [Lepeophtheirus salmonis]|nr:uncharacterized protein LOC121115680 isoform X2 [Lepeophtheirus salmonis]
MEKPRTVMEFEEHAIVYALDPTKDLIFSFHEDGSLWSTQCQSNSSSWSCKKLAQLPELLGKEVYGLYLIKALEMNKEVMDGLEIESPSGTSLFIFIASNDDPIYTCMSYCNDNKVSNPFHLPNHYKNPYLEYYLYPRSNNNLLDLLKFHKKERIKDDIITYKEIVDIQTFPKAFYILDKNGCLFEYNKEYNVTKIQTDVAGFCLRRALGSCIKKKWSYLHLEAAIST